METTSRSLDNAGHMLRTSTTFHHRMLNGDRRILKYSWVLLAFVSFACQQNLTPLSSPAVILSEQAEAPVEKAITFDTSDVVSQSKSFNGQIAEDKLMDFYLRNLLETKWLKATAPSALYFSFLSHLKKAEYLGLNPDAYHISQLEQLVSKVYQQDSVRHEDIINADICITETYLVFASHLRYGRVIDPGHGNKIWIRSNLPADDSDVSLLVSTKTPNDLDETVTKLQPAGDAYVNLQKMLIVYRILAQSEPQVNPLVIRTRLKPGDHHAAVPAIRKRLSFMTIDSNPIVNTADSLRYDSILEVSVRKFQQQHGLEPDGILGEKTVAWMNMSFAEKADLIAVNMERMRWMPAMSATTVIRVNIPEYKLRIYDQGKEALQMNVIVGAVTNATPVFTSALESVVFSPTWTVPAKIIREEFVPRLTKDKTYYAERKNFVFYKNGMEIDPSAERWDSAFNVNNYRIVQKPGPDNALGLVKFIIKNDMNIYLHDTPDHRPFSKYYRALSHGCIRIGEPTQFAAYLLQNNAGWDLKRIKKAMTSGQTENRGLAKHYPVHLEYNTVWMDEHGVLNFREDIYGHDERQLRSLFPARISSNVVARAGR